MTITGGLGENLATGDNGSDTDGWGRRQDAAAGSSRQNPPASIVWEHLAHINSLIVGTHSRHNDSLFVDEGMVDREGSRVASWPLLGPVCCGSEAGSASRQTGKKTKRVKQRVPDP